MVDENGGDLEDHSSASSSKQTTDRRKQTKPKKTGDADTPRKFEDKDNVPWSELTRSILNAFHDGLKLRTSRLTKKAETAAMSRTEDEFHDAVQETITDFYANWDDDQPTPPTREALFDAIGTEAKKRWSTARRRECRRRRLLETRRRVLEEENLQRRDGGQGEQEERAAVEEMFARLENDPEGKLVLHAVLVKGIPFRRTKEIALELGFTVRETTNIKRRITRVAENIERERKDPRGDE